MTGSSHLLMDLKDESHVRGEGNDSGKEGKVFSLTIFVLVFSHNLALNL